MIEIIRQIARNVKSRQSGDMRLRWSAAGMLDTERQSARSSATATWPHFAPPVDREVTATAVTSTATKEVIAEMATV